MELENIREGVRRFGSPTYFFDTDVLRKRMELIRKTFCAGVGICYAVKANPFLVRELDGCVDRFEVCSPGEYEICHDAGISPDKIIVSGVNKTYGSVKRIMELGDCRGIFTVESPRHYEILARLCREKKRRIRALIRLSSGNQFGVDKGTLEALAARMSQDDLMDFAGIHFYSGTQKKFSKAESEFGELDGYARYLSDECGICVDELEYGPGLSVPYFEADGGLDAEAVLGNLCNMLSRASGYGKITVELGRFIASECGCYASSVVDVKTTDGHGYCIVDGGIHQLNYYGQLMGMKKPYMKLIRRGEIYGAAEAQDMAEAPDAADEWCICGSLCTVSDILVKGVRAVKPERGDCFVFERCGAYSVTEGMALFLSRELPQIVFFSKEKGFRKVRGFAPTYGINSYQED